MVVTRTTKAPVMMDADRTAASLAVDSRVRAQIDMNTDTSPQNGSQLRSSAAGDAAAPPIVTDDFPDGASVGTSTAATNATVESLHPDNYPAKIYRALKLLFEAYCYARQSRNDLWDFAVELSDLRETGLNKTDLRWMIVMNYVEAANEVTPERADKRRFEIVSSVHITDSTCFVPTAKGLQLAHDVLATPALIDMVRPTWDSDRRELRLSGVVVKRYKRPCSNQEIILQTFEEEGWRAKIDDPLPQCDDQDAKQRLRGTIKALNRNQRNELIRFSGDGTGEGIRWELTQTRLN